MITFTYQSQVGPDGQKYIDWSAKWDGVYEDGEDNHMHPFAGTLDYIQEQEFRADLEGMSEEEKNRDHVYDVIGGGTINLGNYSKEKPEHHDPDNLREIGDIVADNPATRALCKMLSMSSKQLEKYCGCVTIDGYRNKLLIALNVLWD